MDLQYILDPYACVMYIASHMLKSEKSVGELLKQVSKECDGEQIRTQLRSSSITVKSVLERLSTESCHCLSSSLAERCSLTLLQKVGYPF